MLDVIIEIMKQYNHNSFRPVLISYDRMLQPAELFFKLTGVDINKCPCCSRKMMTRRKLKPKRLDPPEEISIII